MAQIRRSKSTSVHLSLLMFSVLDIYNPYVKLGNMKTLGYQVLYCILYIYISIDTFTQLVESRIPSLNIP